MHSRLNIGLCLFLTVLLPETALSIIRLALLLLLLTLPAPLSQFNFNTHEGVFADCGKCFDDWTLLQQGFNACAIA